MEQYRPRTIHYTQLKDLPTDHVLHREWNAYLRELPRLLAEGHEGKFALVKGDSVIAVFADEREATTVGHERFLIQPFMVQPIREEEPILRVPHYY